MMEAKKYIELQEYDKARKILKGVQHPKAQEWLSKIDQRYPEKKTAFDWKLPLFVVSLSIALVIVIGVAFSVLQDNSSSDTGINTVDNSRWQLPKTGNK